MDNSDKKITVATFHSHYGALLLKKSLGNCCTVRSVPRTLSSSCGTCAFVEGLPLQTISEASDPELLEAIYEKVNDKYTKVFPED